jgi:hypothetical protein
MSRVVTKICIRLVPMKGATKMKPLDERAANEKDCVPCA